MRIINVTLGDKGEVVNVDFVQWIMHELEDGVSTRKDVAQTYSILLQKNTPLETFVEINKAIITRWSPSALRWIKEQAWKMAKAESLVAKEV